MESLFTDTVFEDVLAAVEVEGIAKALTLPSAHKPPKLLWRGAIFFPVLIFAETLASLLFPLPFFVYQKRSISKNTLIR